MRGGAARAGGDVKAQAGPLGEGLLPVLGGLHYISERRRGKLEIVRHRDARRVVRIMVSSIAPQFRHRDPRKPGREASRESPT